MRVDQFKKLLDRFPGDYIVGFYQISSVDRVRFQEVDITAGVVNETRRVGLQLSAPAHATFEEFKEAFEVTLEQ